MFDSMGNVIYTALSAGEVRSHNPNTTADSLIASLGSSSLPADVALEPGLTTMLVSEFGGGKIDRIDLVNPLHPVVQLWPPANGAGSGNPEGLAYDNAGHLFANLGVRGVSTDPPKKYVAQINPVTGAILQQSPCPPGGGPPCLPSLDGLTYDSFTHMLYAASTFGKTVFQINPINLSVVDLGQTYGWNSQFGFDGITSDGLGHLFVVSGDHHDL